MKKINVLFLILAILPLLVVIVGLPFIDTNYNFMGVVTFNKYLLLVLPIVVLIFAIFLRVMSYKLNIDSSFYILSNITLLLFFNFVNIYFVATGVETLNIDTVTNIAIELLTSAIFIIFGFLLDYFDFDTLVTSDRDRFLKVKKLASNIFIILGMIIIILSIIFNWAIMMYIISIGIVGSLVAIIGYNEVLKRRKI